eukprot:scaffold329093_cov54-Tisochrysis_lutea.AAC.1
MHDGSLGPPKRQEARGKRLNFIALRLGTIVLAAALAARDGPKQGGRLYTIHYTKGPAPPLRALRSPRGSPQLRNRIGYSSLSLSSFIHTHTGTQGKGGDGPDSNNAHSVLESSRLS